MEDQEISELRFKELILKLYGYRLSETSKNELEKEISALKLLEKAVDEITKKR